MSLGGLGYGQDVLETLPLLLDIEDNELRREDKSVKAQVTRRPQLNGPGELGTDGTRVEVGRTASGDVELARAGAVDVAGAVELLNAVGVAAGDGDLAVKVGRDSVGAVAVGLEGVLPEAVEVDEELDAVGLLDLLGELDEGADLGRVAGRDAAVGLGTGVVGGTAGEVPVVGPVAVAVGTDAGRAGARLAVLAPEAVGGLGVDEAWRGVSKVEGPWDGQGELTVGVREGDDIVVVLVNETRDVGIALEVAVDQLPSEILNSLWAWLSTRSRMVKIWLLTGAAAHSRA